MRLFARLVASAALDVVNGAPMTMGTDEPFPLSGIAEAEGATPDRAFRHMDMTSRTVGCLSSDEDFPNRFELLGSVLGEISQSPTLTTILPNC